MSSPKAAIAADQVTVPRPRWPSDAVRDCVTAPAEAASEVRKRLGLIAQAPLRITYLAGPGDLYGTHEFWLKGEFDPRVPTIAYSTMFYEVCRRLDADAQVITHCEGPAGVRAADRVRFENFDYGPNAHGISYHLMRTRYALGCNRAVGAFRPHFVVAASDFPWHFLPGLGAAGAPVVLTMHNTIWPMGQADASRISGMKRRLRRFGFAQVGAAIAVSNECKRQLVSIDRRNIPIHVAAPQLLSWPQAAQSEKRRSVVFVGRLEEDKGVFDLLDAFASIAGSHGDACLDFIGEGAALARLRERIFQLGLNDRASCSGRLDAAATHKRLGEAWVHVCPTRSTFCEGLAVVSFEAAIHGTPTIMSSVVPGQELLEGSVAIFPADSVAGLAAALDKVLGDPGHRAALGAAAREKSAIAFDRTRSWGSLLCVALLGLASK